MLSPVMQHQPNYAIKMMERLDIDPGGGVLPRLSLLYATASYRCDSCPSKRAVATGSSGHLNRWASPRLSAETMMFLPSYNSEA